MDFSAYNGAWKFLSNIREGTLSPRQPTRADIAAVKFQPTRLTYPMQQFLNGVQIQDETRAVTIWTDTTGGYVPKPPDQFTDDAGQAWIVLMATSSPIGSDVSLLLQRQQK
jgi:hypothetical protein